MPDEGGAASDVENICNVMKSLTYLSSKVTIPLPFRAELRDTVRNEKLEVC